LNVEIEDGQEFDQIYKGCCEGAGGVVFKEDSEHGKSLECVFVKEDLEIKQPQSLPMNHSVVTQGTLLRVPQAIPQARIGAFGVTVSRLFR